MIRSIPVSKSPAHDQKKYRKADVINKKMDLSLSFRYSWSVFDFQAFVFLELFLVFD